MKEINTKNLLITSVGVIAGVLIYEHIKEAIKKKENE